MQNARCFLCGHKMLESGLCSNDECIRSKALTESKNSEKETPAATAGTAETQAESEAGA